MAKIKELKELNQFQREFLNWGVSKKRMLLQAPPGSGKSLAMISFFVLLRKQGFVSKAFVVTKTKAMSAFIDDNFCGFKVKTFKTESDLNYLYSSNPFTSDLYIFSSSLLSKLKDNTFCKQGLFKLLESCGIIFVDEVHEFRNYKGKASSGLKMITDYYQRFVDSDNNHRICCCTATPIYKNLENWYSLFQYIEPRLFGSYNKFLYDYCIVNQRSFYANKKVVNGNGSSRFGVRSQFNEIVGYQNTDDLYAKLSNYLFSWNDTDFSFNYSLVYYDLDNEEASEYRKAIKGLGLDKSYCVTLVDNKSGDREVIYRDSTDFLYTLARDTVPVRDIYNGTGVWYNNRAYTVESVLDHEKDGTYSKRMIDAQKVVSNSKDKLKKLVEVIESDKSGCLVYVNYHESVDKVISYLRSVGLQRRLFVITGNTPNFERAVKALRDGDVAIITRVARQSVNFYFPRMVIYEPETTPGGIEQLFGRLTRFDSKYRDITVYYMIRPQSIEEYFYMRLRLLLQTAKTNIYSKGLPKSVTLKDVDDSKIDIAFLKRKLLWKV